MGGVGDGSGRSAGLDSAQLIALLTKPLASCGVGLTQKVVAGLGGGCGEDPNRPSRREADARRGWHIACHFKSSP